MFSIQQYPCILFPFVFSSYSCRKGNTPHYLSQYLTPKLNHLISWVFLSTTATKLAAAGCSQTKLWFRMWSMESKMFFAPPSIFVYCRPLLTTWLPFLYCHVIFVLLVIEINLCLWINSGFAKCQEFQNVILFLVSGAYPESHYSLQPSKYWKYDQHHLFPVWFKLIHLLYGHVINEFIEWVRSRNLRLFLQYHLILHIQSLSYNNLCFQQRTHFFTRPLLFRHKSKETNQHY
jgi:hypothetical protein